MADLDLAAAVAEMDRRLRAEDSLYEFLKQAWHVIEPSEEFVDNWHIQAVCEHLEEVSNGRVRNLLINFPPRMLKTIICSVAWPAWEWLHRPGTKFVYASYSWTLAEDASIRCRSLIKSDWYRVRWGDRFSLLEDRDKKDLFGNNKGGERIITSPDATITGRGGQVIVCLPYDAIIQTKWGPYKIGELVEKKLDVEVLAYDHATSQPVWARIEEHEKSHGRPLIEIESSSGKKVRLTEDHPVFVVGRGYVAAKDVRLDDEILEA